MGNLVLDMAYPNIEKKVSFVSFIGDIKPLFPGLNRLLPIPG